MTKVDSWLGMISQERLTGELTVDSGHNPITSRPCALFFDIKVYPAGDINLCSCRNVLKDPDMQVGHINEITLAEALDRIPGMAKTWAQGHIPASCQKCMMYIDPSLGFLGRLRSRLQM